MRSRTVIVYIITVVTLGAAGIGCDFEEQRQCEQLSLDTQDYLAKTHELMKSVGETSNLIGMLNPAFLVKTKTLEIQNDSIADRWEKVTPSCKEQVTHDLGPVLAKLSLPEGWTPNKTVEARDQRRAEEAQKAQEEAEQAAREAHEAAVREKMQKALAVTLVEIRAEPRSLYSSFNNYTLPVNFENRSDETILGASGRLTCFNTLENNEGFFYTEQTDLNIAPGKSTIITLASDDIRHRWLQFAKCTKQVWEPEAIRLEKEGLLRASLSHR